MTDDWRPKLDALTQLNLSVRRELEEAEHYVPAINRQVQSLLPIGIPEQLAVEGNIVLELPYLPDQGLSDSCQVYQAVLLVPEGIGAAVYDLEEFLERRRSLDSNSSPRSRFLPFDECNGYIMSALLPQVGSLLDQLLTMLGRRAES